MSYPRSGGITSAQGGQLGSIDAKEGEGGGSDLLRVNPKTKSVDVACQSAEGGERNSSSRRKQPIAVGAFPL